MPPISEVENLTDREEPVTILFDADLRGSKSAVMERSSSDAIGSESPDKEHFSATDKTAKLRLALITFAISAIAGAVLGLSAPGYDLWYLTWIGVAPLFALIFSASSSKTAFARSFIFGACYNLVYLHWFLSLDPVWAWFSPKYTMLTAVFWWLFASFHQGTIFGVFALLARKIPLKANSMRRDALPAIVVLPLLWVILFNKIGNSSWFVGIPWSMVEYSQYKNLELLQIAKYIGGIGIGATIILFNTAVFLIFAAITNRRSSSLFKPASWFKPQSSLESFKSELKPSSIKLACSSLGPSKRECLLSASFAGLVVCGILAYGHASIANPVRVDRKPIAISLVQGNLAGAIHGVESPEVITRYVTMSQQAPLGVCVWTEWVLPISLNKNKPILNALLALAASQHKDWLIGALERNGKDTYNAIYGVTSTGTVGGAPYRKRFLVPFGEFLPDWMTKAGLRGLIATCSPHRCSLQNGTSANVIKLKSASAGALICLEVVSPELAADSVRSGAEILTDLSNTTWFTSPDVGKQLIAFSVMRAAETSRSVSFCTTTGPSAIIHTDGRILGMTKSHQPELLSRTTYRRTDLTPFVRWFR